MFYLASELHFFFNEETLICGVFYLSLIQEEVLM